nr:hypothetical protein Iba_chr07cCG7210 [Ipomoea batatas]
MHYDIQSHLVAVLVSVSPGADRTRRWSARPGDRVAYFRSARYCRSIYRMPMRITLSYSPPCGAADSVGRGGPLFPWARPIILDVAGKARAVHVSTCGGPLGCSRHHYREPFRLPARPINKALARAPEDTHLPPSFSARASQPSNSLRSEYEDYDDAIETTPTGASLASSTGSAGEVGANDGWVGEGDPRRGKSPMVVIAHLHEELPQYSPATQETILANLPPRPTAAEAVSVPHSVEPSSSQPSASSGGNLVPLSSDDVRNHPCLLTLSELEETKTLLTGRVEFQT